MLLDRAASEDDSRVPGRDGGRDLGRCHALEDGKSAHGVLPAVIESWIVNATRYRRARFRAK